MLSIKKLVAVAAAGAAAMVLSAGTASADEYAPAQNPADYLQGDTAYFSYGSAANCAMHPGGIVGCDLPNGMIMSQVPFTPRVYDVQIDVPWFPAHPTFGIGGPRGRAGSTPLQGTLSYGGATCEIGVKGQLTCTSMGRSFVAWTPYLNVS